MDLPQGKNLVGAFWQPSLVLVDPDTLKTLPSHFYADGMAEVIKTACIKDAFLFQALEENTDVYKRQLHPENPLPDPRQFAYQG